MLQQSWSFYSGLKIRKLHDIMEILQKPAMRNLMLYQMSKFVML